MGRVIPPKIPRPNIQVRDNLGVSTVIIDNGGNELISIRDNEVSIMARKPLLNVAQNMINGIAELVNADYNYATTATTRGYNPLTRAKTPIENRFILPKELFEAVDFTDMGVVEEAKNAVPTFIIGEKYSLKGVSCEGFEMPEKVYELVAIHDEFDGININSLIVKQISGDQDKIFTLSKNDCDHIGIEYEKGLQLFPKHLNWQRVKDVIPFESSNLGTTPLSDIDNTIRYVLLKLDGFKDYADGYILTPSGKIIKEKQFENTLMVTSNEPIVYTNPTNKQNGIRIQEGTPLDIKVVYPKTLNFNHGNFISNEDTIYVLITLAKRVIKRDAIDGLYGVEKDLLEGFNPNDHFSISWDELGAYTVEEYEAEKARKEAEKQARLAKEEEARMKRIAEEEKRIKEQRRRTEEAVERMKRYNIKLPQFPKMVDFNMDNGVSSLNLYMDGLDLYFDTLDTSLSKLSNDLSSMARTIGVNLDKRAAKNAANATLFDMFKL